MQNKLVKSITINHKKKKGLNLVFRKLYFLKVKNIFDLEVSKFIVKLNSNKLPQIFRQYFTRACDAHMYSTRNTQTNNFFYSKNSTS